MTSPLRFGDLYKDSADALKPLPDGEYEAVVMDAEATKSQNDKPMIKVKLNVSMPGGAKKVIPTQIVVSAENPTALAIFFRQMEAFGLDADFWTNDVTLEQAANVMRNRRVRVVLGTRPWNGQDRNEVKNYLAPLGGPQLGSVPTPTVLGGPTAGSPLGGPSVPAQPVGTPLGAGTTASPASDAKPVAF